MNQILSILKVKSDVLGMSAFRVTIADETINTMSTTSVSVSSLSDFMRAQRTWFENQLRNHKTMHMLYPTPTYTTNKKTTQDSACDQT